MKQITATDPGADEAELLAIIRASFFERMPFNRILGIELLSLHHDQPELRFDMRPELVGNYIRNILHGGVISSVLDVTGGLVAFLGVQQKLKGKPVAEVMERFSRIGTIDLRIDYLRPGAGEWFLARGFPLRTGNKVAVTRMELFNDQHALIAVGTAAYTVS
ncbi:MAG: thioesterase family protein [Rhodocyclaceae bacterium]|nr:thioesterase family protein [Rhodocyclaceae bacterium]